MTKLERTAFWMTIFAISVPATCGIVVALGIALVIGMVPIEVSLWMQLTAGFAFLLIGLTVPISLRMTVKSTK